MSVYLKAASAILDSLWEDPAFRDFFYDRGYDLGSLGALIGDVFVPAYLSVKRMLEGGALEMLETQVTEDLLVPLYNRPNFREAWNEWDQATRDTFLREQSEMQLGLLLAMAYDAQLASAYRQAFLDHLNHKNGE